MWERDAELVSALPAQGFPPGIQEELELWGGMAAEAGVITEGWIVLSLEESHGS